MNEKLLLVRFFWDCGRMGDVEGLFVTTQVELENAYGKQVYFGEILGKHSEIYGHLGPDAIIIKSEDQEFIKKLIDLLGWDISGYNPLRCIQNYKEEEESEDD